MHKTSRAKRAKAQSPKKKTSKKAKPAKKATAKKKQTSSVKKIAATKKRAVKKATAPRAVKLAPAPSPAGLRVVSNAAEMQARMMEVRAQGLTIGFVPTMGALHEGHAALLLEAKKRADVVVCSIFVNPKQFGDASDLARYPRDIEADVALCRGIGVDVVFAPSADDVYAADFSTTVGGGEMTRVLEGASRPGHFDGVLTIVTLLFQLVQPHFAVFGEKDYQQLTLVRRLVRDLRLPVEIVAMPVVRSLDGLALSSRNARLSVDERKAATCLYRALMAAQDAVQEGETAAARIVARARAALAETPSFTPDHVVVCDPVSLSEVQKLDRPARLILSGKLGPVCLIDNGPLFPGVTFRP